MINSVPNVLGCVKKSLVSVLAPLSALVMSAFVVATMLYRASAHGDPGIGLDLSPEGWAILIAGVACSAISVGLIFYSRYLHAHAQAGLEKVSEQPATTAVDGPVVADKAADAVEKTIEREISLLSLPEDERRIFEVIDASGGEMLQKNLVASGEFSRSKVTRLLDKLEGRGLIKRERHGMTNMVRLTKEP